MPVKLKVSDVNKATRCKAKAKYSKASGCLCWNKAKAMGFEAKAKNFVLKAKAKA